MNVAFKMVALKTENSPNPQLFAIFNYNLQHVVAAGWQLVVAILQLYPLSERRVTDELHSSAETDSD